MMTIKWQHPGILLASLMMLAACSNNTITGETDGDTGGKTGSFEKRSACGNEPVYTIEGKSYQVLDSSAGYSETGTAAWYGAEYQGTQTAGCETFDMNSYSAAHRSLPLPSFVRVTNQQNGKSVVVRVNDRGPFDSNDLIQLSFAAANALGISNRSGTPVKLDALSPEQFAGQDSSGEASINVVQEPPRAPEPVDKSKVYYVVAGTWPERNDAIDMFVRLTSVGLSKTEMASAQEKGKQMFQVRIGPLYNQDQVDNVKDALQSNGLATFRVVAR